MKTIFDKIDPKYVECSTGVCEHAAHNHNIALWVVVAMLLAATKYWYGHKNC